MSLVNLSISRKLTAMAGAIVLLAGGALAYLAYEIRQSDDVINAVIHKQAQALGRLQTVQAAAKQFGESRVWLTDLAVSWQNESEQNADAALEALQVLLGTLATTDPDTVGTIRVPIEQFQAAMIEAVDAYVGENRVLGNAKVAEGRGFASVVIDGFDGLLLAADKQAKDATGALTQNNTTLLVTALVGIAVAVVIGGVLTWLCARAISRPLNRAVDVAEQISIGNFDSVIEAGSTDETGQLLNSLATMQSNLKGEDLELS